MGSIRCRAVDRCKFCRLCDGLVAVFCLAGLSEKEEKRCWASDLRNGVMRLTLGLRCRKQKRYWA